MPAATVERARPRRRYAAAVGAAVVVGAAAAAVLFADHLDLDHRTPFVQVMAFRPQLAVGLVVAAALLATTGRGRWPVALALGLVGLLGIATVAPRTTAEPPGTDPSGRDPTALAVLTLNTYLGRADPGAVADLVRARAPDLVALPEAGGELRRRLEARLSDDTASPGRSGYRSFVADAAGAASPMTVFVKRSLGRPVVAEDQSGTFPGIVVDLPRGLRFVAVHPLAPKPGDTGQWRSDVAGLARWCSGGRPTVVAGDMNATADHRAFREATAACTDAGAAVGAGLTGTWPAGLPRVLGAQIDHVLLAGGPRAVGVEVLDVPGTDHRAVLARVATG